MTNHDDWRSALTAQDTALWCAFADWLEERGDERAQYVRQCAVQRIRPDSENRWWSGRYPESSNTSFSHGGVWDFHPKGTTGLGLEGDDQRPITYETIYDALLALADACLKAQQDGGS